ncbi:hypothetical protein KP509_1Z079200 [Ceratopteris richardii]|nr:hypothetical protein KP509_1Z079200 [Ceratopteris richardii]
MRIHDYAVKSGLESSVYIGNALVSLYVNCGNLEAASTVFSQVLGRDVITWSTLMGGYAQEGQMQETFKLLAEMQQHDVKPNTVSYIHILDGCANADGFEEGGMLIHASIVEDGIDDDELVGSVLIDMYGKWGMVEEAYKVFDRLPHRDAVTWTSMIGAFTQAGDEYAQYALKLYEQMELEGTQPNNIMYLSVLKLCAHLSDSWYGHEIHHRIVASGCDRDIMVASSLIDMYIKAGEIDDGFHVFEELPKRNVVVWSSIIMGYVELGFSDTALYLFQQMQKEGIEPDVTSIVCILKACGCVAALEQGKIIHGYVIKRGFEMDVHVGSALICMYSSCGSLDDGVDVFEGLQVRNVVVFNAMITGFAKNNNFSLALKTYSAMEGCECKPNGVTYLSLLTACSNLGLVKEGCDLFKSMKEDVNLLELDHYNTLVDIFGHAGLLLYSEDLLETIPFQANSVGWLSLLSSCRTFRDITVGRRCFERVVTLEPMNSAAYVLMSRIYDLVGLYEDAIGLEILRRSRKAWKLPGTSCIEVDQKVHRFTVQEYEHLRSMEIKTRIRNIIQKWKQEQSLPQNIVDAGIVVEDDEFCEHCEMSAVGFGLISTPQGKTLRITKNLCICSNCHSVLKFISKSEKRRIVLIDAFCVHDFKDGVCTCSNFLYRDLSYR